MRQITLWLPLLGASLLTACAGSGQSPTAPDSTPQSDPLNSSVIGGLADTEAGMVQGAIGISQLHIDPVTLQGAITTPRLAQTQGDLYHLSIRPFFGPKDVVIRGITRGPGDTIDVDIQFTHPYDAPADLNPPATATKRIDLHIFDVSACVMVDGTETFFDAPEDVTLNPDILVNADGYRSVGGTVDLAGMGITTANIFPYKLVGNIDTGDPSGNYIPTANGWTGASLLAPTGYDVFPQGGVATSTFRFDVTNGAIDLNIATIAKYMDPRSTPNPKSKRLPVAGDPTALQYILPEAAGDVHRIEATITDTLIGGSNGEIANLDLTILDWDHDAAVASTFPNNANLNEISEASAIETVEVDVPDIQAANFFSGGSISGTAPLWNVTVGLVNVDLFDPASATEVLACVRISDQQDADNGTDTTIPIALDESLAPVPALSSNRYQIVRVTVEPANSGPSCPDYGAVTWPLLAVVGVPYSLDLDSAPLPAADPDGIALYELDYNNDGTYDAATNVLNGNELPDFSTPYSFSTAGPATMKLRMTDGSVDANQNVCDLNITVEAAIAPVLDPLPTPGGINVDMANTNCTMQVTQQPDLLVAKPTGEVYFTLRRGAAPFNWVTYKSTNNAGTWGLPNTVPEPFPTPINASISATTGTSIGIMADGRPCIATIDSGADLLFKRAASDAGTVVDWGPATEGSEIEIAGTWATPSMLPHPTNVNRVYILAKNSSSTLGVNPFSSTLWVSNNATSANPTFTAAGVMDTDGNVTNEIDPIACIDSLGNVHAVWCSASATANLVYRRWDDTAQAWDPEVVLAAAGTDIVSADDPNIAVNAANEPAVLVNNAISGLESSVHLTKFNTGSGWTELRKVNDTTYPNINSSRKLVGVMYDGSGRIHAIWREDGVTDTWDNSAVAVFSADGRRKLGADFFVFTATSATDDFTSPRLQWLPAVNKMLAVALANGVVTDGKARYRTYSVP